MTVGELREEDLTVHTPGESDPEVWTPEEEIGPEAYEPAEEEPWEETGEEEVREEDEEENFGLAKDGEVPVKSAQRESDEPAKRDFGAEALELLREYPQLRGQQLPDAVLAECARGQRLLQAYRSYEFRENRAELQRLRRENEALKHNAEAARRAPVWGVSGGGSTDNSPADPFLDGFQGEF